MLKQFCSRIPAHSLFLKFLLGSKVVVFYEKKIRNFFLGEGIDTQEILSIGRFTRSLRERETLCLWLNGVGFIKTNWKLFAIR